MTAMERRRLNPRLLLPAAGVLAFALFFAVAAPQAARHARQCLRSWSLTALPALEVRQQVFGEPYVAAVETIRRALPEDSAYFLVDGNPTEPGPVYWLRYDLAPRRALFLGPLESLSSATLRHRPRTSARLVVISGKPGEPPQLLSRAELVTRLRSRTGEDAH